MGAYASGNGRLRSAARLPCASCIRLATRPAMPDPSAGTIDAACSTTARRPGLGVLKSESRRPRLEPSSSRSMLAESRKLFQPALKQGSRYESFAWNRSRSLRDIRCCGRRPISGRANALLDRCRRTAAPRAQHRGQDRRARRKCPLVSRPVWPEGRWHPAETRSLFPDQFQWP